MDAYSVLRRHRIQPSPDALLQVVADFPQHDQLCGRSTLLTRDRAVPMPRAGSKRIDPRGVGLPSLAECDPVSYWHARQELTDRLRSQPFRVHARFSEHTAGVFQDGLWLQPSATHLERLARPESEQGFSDLTAVRVRGIEKEHPGFLVHHRVDTGAIAPRQEMT